MDKVRKYLMRAVDALDDEAHLLQKSQDDLAMMLEALEIPNVHNAKQRVSKLVETEAKYEALKLEIVNVTGADNFGNGMKTIRTRFNAPLTHTRHRILEVAPPHWLETTDATRVETALNSCDRVLSQILEKLPETERQERVNVLDEVLWDPSVSCKDFQKGLMKDLAYLSSNYREADVAPAGQPSATDRVSFIDKLDSVFVTDHLSATAIEQLAAAPRVRTHSSVGLITESLDRELASPSMKGEFAYSVAKNLLIDLLWPDAEPLVFDQSDQGIAFSEAFTDRQHLFDALNAGGTEYVKELTDLALAVLE